MELKGKVAIVTGASKGIGLATVKMLLDAGAKVAGWSRSAPGIDNANYRHFNTDVSDHGSVGKAFEETTEHFGEDISILVNNAGYGLAGKMDEMPVEQWEDMFKVNVNGIFYCTRLVLPLMKRLGEAHIINIASIAGNTGIEGMSAYCGTKHAVAGISHSLYKEVRSDGIKVTCIYPGSVQTNFFDHIDSVQANENMMQPQDISSTIMHALSSSGNYHHVDIEVRPLKPKG